MRSTRWGGKNTVVGMISISPSRAIARAHGSKESSGRPRRVIPAGPTMRSRPHHCSRGEWKYATTKVSGSTFGQLDQDALPGVGMQEDDALAVRPRRRDPVEKTISLRGQIFDDFLEIRDFEAQVVQPTAAPEEELRDRRIVGRRLQQLQPRVPERQEGRPHLLRRHLLAVRDLETEIPVDRKRVVDRDDRDADVIEAADHALDCRGTPAYLS